MIKIQSRMMIMKLEYNGKLPDVHKSVFIASSAVVQGCRIKNMCLIGIGAIVLDGAVVGEQSIVAAGSVVKEGMIVPPRTLVAGIPAVVKRELTQEDIDYIMSLANNYVGVAKSYLALPGQ
jgi:carbonic anhydrase/acetyltransferase-like protein (isoleucine patch superfamily)